MAKGYKGIIGHAPLSTVQDIELVMPAAEDVEAKLSLAAKQVQTSLSALQNGSCSLEKTNYIFFTVCQNSQLIIQCLN